jgi:hypothetical protein
MRKPTLMFNVTSSSDVILLITESLTIFERTIKIWFSAENNSKTILKFNGTEIRTNNESQALLNPGSPKLFIVSYNQMFALLHNGHHIFFESINNFKYNFFGFRTK